MCLNLCLIISTYWTNHGYLILQQDTAKMAFMIGKVIDLGILPTEAFECLLSNNQFCGEC